MSTKYLSCLIEVSQSDTWNVAIPHGQPDSVYDRIRAGSDWDSLKRELLLKMQEQAARKKQRRNAEWSNDGEMGGEPEVPLTTSSALPEAFELSAFHHADPDQVLASDHGSGDERYAELVHMMDGLASPESDEGELAMGSGSGSAEEPQAANEARTPPVQAVPQAVPPATTLQAMTGRWGIFRLGIKKPSHVLRHGAIEASCPLHARNAKTGCKKLISCKDRTPESAIEAANIARWWCIQGLKVQRQWEHVFETPLSPCPSVAEISAMLVSEMPAGHSLVTDADFYAGKDSGEAPQRRASTRAKRPTPQSRQKRTSGSIDGRDSVHARARPKRAAQTPEVHLSNTLLCNESACLTPTHTPVTC